MIYSSIKNSLKYLYLKVESVVIDAEFGRDDKLTTVRFPAIMIGRRLKSLDAATDFRTRLN
jgi:hypothetical protein